jgi:hypothetical protein
MIEEIDEEVLKRLPKSLQIFYHFYRDLKQDKEKKSS